MRQVGSEPTTSIPEVVGFTALGLSEKVHYIAIERCLTLADKLKIHIETPQEEKHKLIKWYGWITIILVCLTPIVFYLLPMLMLNTSKINKMLRESRIPEENSLAGTVEKVNWEAKHESGVHFIEGMLNVENDEEEIIPCKFLKYVGPEQKELPDINVGDKVEITGQLIADENKFVIRNIRKVTNGNVYTTEPALAVY